MSLLVELGRRLLILHLVRQRHVELHVAHNQVQALRANVQVDLAGLVDEGQLHAHADAIVGDCNRVLRRRRHFGTGRRREVSRFRHTMSGPLRGKSCVPRWYVSRE